MARKSKEEIEENNRQERINKYISDSIRDSVNLRKDKMEYSGLEQEFISILDKMLEDFRRTLGIKHLGDKGNSREELLKDFLRQDFLPKRFGISKGSSKVISTEGKSSKQIDLLIYDELNTPRLLSVGNLQYFPVESVYGVIEVKSNLDSTKTITDALENLASFKSLNKKPINGKHNKGFGILFAFIADLEWDTIIDCVKSFQNNKNNNELLPNLIVILDKGLIGFSENGWEIFESDQLNSSKNLKLCGNPNHKDFTLLHFYLVLMDLLTNLDLKAPQMREYVNLQISSKKHSYRFNMGHFSEIANCKKHGKYIRDLTDESMEKIINTCKNQTKVNHLVAMNIAYEKEVWGKEQIEKSYDVYIYNPKNLELKDLLFRNGGFIAYDEIIIDDEIYLIPHKYSFMEELINSCPKCPSFKELLEKKSMKNTNSEDN